MSHSRDKAVANKLNICFIHPDLGIGGAERLVVDAAVGLQHRDHSVTIFTSHCDPRHCFDEVRNGTLSVRVRGNSVFPPKIFNRFSIFCAILRQLHLTFSLYFFTPGSSSYRVFFVDQLSACIPLLRLFFPEARILFYCHFPDKYLASRTSLVKKFYRLPFDWLEGWTTGMADVLVVNSKFTAGVFAQAFSGIKATPRVVYPCVDTRAGNTTSIDITDGNNYAGLAQNRKILLSINRFERKKNIELAIEAFSELSVIEKQQARLIIAGGYDSRITENVTYHTDLQALCEKLGLKHATCKNYITALSVPKNIDVLFLLSIPASLKTYLLKTASLLLYTPANEHFGIVPLEAMLAEIPVLAVDSGGPLETVDDSITGWLRPSEVSEWTTVIRIALFGLSPEGVGQMGMAGRRRVEAEFSKEKMAECLEREMLAMVAQKRYYGWSWWKGAGGLLLGVVVGLFAIGYGYGYLWFSP